MPSAPATTALIGSEVHSQRHIAAKQHSVAVSSSKLNEDVLARDRVLAGRGYDSVGNSVEARNGNQFALGVERVGDAAPLLCPAGRRLRWPRPSPGLARNLWRHLLFSHPANAGDRNKDGAWRLTIARATRRDFKNASARLDRHWHRSRCFHRSRSADRFPPLPDCADRSAHLCGDGGAARRGCAVCRLPPGTKSIEDRSNGRIANKLGIDHLASGRFWAVGCLC